MTSATIDQTAFDNAIKNNTPQQIQQLDQMLDSLNNSPTLVNELTTFLQNPNNQILISNSNESTAIYQNGQITGYDINIQNFLLNQTSQITDNAENTGAELGHELGHIELPNGWYPDVSNYTIQQYVEAGLNAEAIATMNSEQIANEYNSWNASNNYSPLNGPINADVSSQVQDAINQAGDRTDSSLYNQQSDDVISYFRNANPSAAPNISYTQYLEDSYVISKLDGPATALTSQGFNNQTIDWSMVTPDNFSVTTNPDGSWSASGTNISDKPGDTYSFSASSDASGNVYGFVNVTSIQGILTSYVSGQNASDPVSNADVSVTSGSGIITGNNDVITVAAGANATVIGSADTVNLSDNSKSTLSISGANDTVNSNQNAVDLTGDSTSVQLNGNQNAVSIGSSNQTLGITGGANTVTIGSNETGVTINGDASSPSNYEAIQAGDNDTFTLTNMGAELTAGASTTAELDLAWGEVTVGDDSTLTLDKLSYTVSYGGSSSSSDSSYDINQSNGALVVHDVANFNLTGSGDTINVDGTKSANSYSSMTGNNNIYTGSATQLGVLGSNNTITMADGGIVVVGDESGDDTGDIVNLSNGEVSFYNTVASATDTLNGSGNVGDLEGDGIELYDGTYNINGDSNRVTMIDDQTTANIAGSNNVVSGDGGIVNFLSGTGGTINTVDSTINASAGTYTLTGDSNTFTGAAGSMIALVQSQSEGNYVDENNIAISQSTIVLSSNGDSFSEFDVLAVTGSDDSIQGNETIYDLTLTGDNETIGISNSTVDFSGGSQLVVTDSGDTINASNTTVAFNAVQSGSTLTLHGDANSVQATDQSITFNGATTASVDGAGNTITTTNATLTLADVSASDSTTLDGYGNTVTGGAGSYVINGGSTLNAGDGSTIQVKQSGAVLNVSNAQITLADNINVTITGSGDQITGGNGDGLTVAGTNDTVTANNGTINFGSNNSGDTVTGPGDTGSNWFAPDPDLPPGDNGGYTPPQTDSAMRASSVLQSRLSPDSIPVPAIQTPHTTPDLHSLIHSLAAFTANDSGAGLSLTSSLGPMEHLQLAAAA